MNHNQVKQLIKMGELKAILKNIDKDGVIRNNCIVLAKNSEVLLRTNGVVVYGLYDQTGAADFKSNSDAIHFTHDLSKPFPYVQCDDYAVMKPKVLKAYKKIFDQKAKDKLEAVRYIAINHKWYREQLNAISENTVENKIEEKKEEVKNMNKELNTMELAHKLRKDLKLEGNYRVQMAIALSYAHDIKKGMSLEEAELNLIKKISIGSSKLKVNNDTTATAPTYNVANNVIDEVSVTADTPNVIANHDVVNECYLVKNNDHFLIEVRNIINGKSFRYPNKIVMPSENAAYIHLHKLAINLVKGLPHNTKLYVSQLTYNLSITNAELTAICKAKNIVLELFTKRTVVNTLDVS